MSTIWKNGKYQPLVKYVTLKDLKKLSNAIDIINGDSDTKGSIKKAIKDLVGEAPEAYDTLKEIADKLKSDDDLHKALNDAIILKASSDALNTEINRATSAETVNKNAIDGEVTRAKSAEKSLQDQITSNDSDITNLTAKHESLSRKVQGIAATGGASTATAVTYDNDDSGLNAENAQDAIDELQGSKIDKTSIAQTIGEAENKVMSQKAVSNKFDDIIKANLPILNTRASAYIHKTSTGLAVTNLPEYSVLCYDVSDIAGTYIAVKGGIVGLEVVIYAFANSTDLNNSTVVEIGDVYNSRTIINYSKVLKIPSNAKYIFITQAAKSQISTMPLLLAKEITAADNIKDIELLRQDVATNNAEIKKLNNQITRIDDIIDVNLPILNTRASAYIHKTSTGLAVTNLPEYSVLCYDVSDIAGTYIAVKGGIVGLEVVIYAFANSTDLNNSTVVEIGDVYNSRTIINYSKVLKIPSNAKYIFITQAAKSQISTMPLLLAKEITAADNIKDIELLRQDVATNNAEIKKLNNQITESTNKAWLLKTEVDRLLAKDYPTHNIPLLSRLNNRYNFGNVNMISNITVPNIGENVVITIDNNPDINNSYTTTEKLFKVNDEICVGSKTFYDRYKILAIQEFNLTCKLIECNTGFIGKMLNAKTIFTNSVSSQSIINNIRVMRSNDIKSYNSNELPRSFSFDGIHPNSKGYDAACYIIADIISNVYGKPNRVYTFGDSWTADSKGFAKIADILKCTVVNKGISGDRIEQIFARFENFMSSYVPSENDVFVFIMGTNNLLDISRNGDDLNKQLYNSSYVSLFADTVEKISEKLPLGNWLVGNGHVSSTSYK